MNALGPSASVLALIPHHDCERWLGDALASLIDQTRPPDAIAVIDDASPDLGALMAVARQYPQVTFLTSDRNVGPYALIQRMMTDTNYDGYLFQDADDWSAPTRVESLLRAADATGAELIGSWEMRVLCDAAEVLAVTYPLDVSGALAADPTAFSLLHPTSLVASHLVSRVGGYSTGLRFSGDAEFLWRAAHAARIVNVASYGYHRRKRANSLTTAAATGLHSVARLELHEALRAEARSRHQAAANGQQVDLTPYATATVPVLLDHLAGPQLANFRPTEVAAS